MRSKRIVLHDPEKIMQINPESKALFEKYKIDMMMRNLSPCYTEALCL